jgi:signal transduction histidine kinase
MSAAPQPSLKLLQNQEVLGELLHSLSQPLTSLRCSLELSFDEVAEQQQATVSVALQQTEKVIGMIQLMREYLDAEEPGSEAHPVALAPAVRAVVEELSSIGALRGIRLPLAGTCTASVPVPEPRLRLALQYLLAALIQTAPANSEITLRLEEGSSESVLRVECEKGARPRDDGARAAHSKRDSVSGTLGKVRIAIASRVLEAAGAFLTFEGGDRPGFVLRIPRWLATSSSPA